MGRASGGALDYPLCVGREVLQVYNAYELRDTDEWPPWLARGLEAERLED